jgi:predicted CoA-binding protein
VNGRWGDDETVRRLLLDTTTWAVVGLSGDPMRPAYGVASFLQSIGKRVVPVHPAGGVVLGEPVATSVAEATERVGAGLDVVDVFRRPDAAGAVADEAVEAGAGAVWFQLGVVDEAAYERVTATGTAMVMNRCPAIEWPRLRARAG